MISPTYCADCSQRATRREARGVLEVGGSGLHTVGFTHQRYKPCNVQVWIEGGGRGRAGRDEKIPTETSITRRGGESDLSLFDEETGRRGGGEAGRRGDGADLSLFDEKPRILDLGIPLHSRFGGTHANPACTLTPAEGYVWWCGPGSQHEGFLACPHPQNHPAQRTELCGVPPA